MKNNSNPKRWSSDPLNRPKYPKLKLTAYEPDKKTLKSFERLSAQERDFFEQELRTKRYPSGKMYIGEFLEKGEYWVPQGIGEFRASKGDEPKYVGEHRQGRMQGYGVYMFDNGDEYSGQFLSDKPDGIGVVKFFNTGIEKVAIYDSGERVCFVDGKHYDEIC